MKNIDKKAVFEELERRRAERQKLEEAVAKARAKRNANLNESKKAVNEKATVVKETPRKHRAPQTINEAINARTRNFSGEAKHMYTVLAENIAKATQTIYGEATQAGAGLPGVVGNGAGVGLMKTYFDIFFGYFPSLIVPEIASTQPIKTEKAMIFYYQTVAGSDKGAVKKGDVLISPFEVNTDPEYTSNKVTVKVPAGVSSADYSVVMWGPVVEVYKLDSNGDEGDALVAGTGYEISGNNLVLKSATTNEVYVYYYANKYAPTQVPELNANIDSREIVAKARTIKTNYSFQAGFGFEAQFGTKLEDKLAEAAMYELKRETDLDFVFEVMNAAPTKVNWNKSAGLAQGLYEFHKLSFIDAVANASNLIFKKSKRHAGNVLLVGINAQTIVQTLPQFKGETYGSQLEGAKVIGKLGDNIKVIAIPELGNDDWAVIYKNPKDNLDAGIVFAPYIPVVATPTVMLDDFLARKAYTTSYGKLVVNADYFVVGEIVDNPVAAQITILDKEGNIIENFGDSTPVTTE